MKRLCSVLLLVLTVQAQQARETRFDVSTPPSVNPIAMAISPDGDKIVFVARSQGKDELWIHSLSSGTDRPLPGTEGVLLPSPCWSPDSKNVAFFAGNLKRIDIETGVIRTLGAGGSGRGCTWSRSGIILYGIQSSRSIMRLSDEGGTPQAATPPSLPVTNEPQFLPDDRHFLYFVEGDGVFVGELAGANPKRLLSADSSAVYSPTGHLLFTRGNTLLAQRFDAETLTLSGEPFTVAEPVPTEVNQAAMSVSSAGNLVYRLGAGGATIRQLKWFDRAGKEVGTLGEPMSLAASPVVISPNGRFLAIARTLNGNSGLWSLEVATGKLNRLTQPSGTYLYPLWSPDSQTLYFTSDKTRRFELYQMKAIESAEEKLITPSNPVSRLIREISPDGRFILYPSPAGLSAIQLDGNPPGDFPVVQVRSANWPRFSPDGRWIAYQSSASGRNEVYLQPFPSGRQWPVSSSGGVYAQWGSGGKEVLFIAPDNKLMSAPVDLSDAAAPKIGTPVELFSPQIRTTTFAGANDGLTGPPYIVSEDGQRFLFATIIYFQSPIKVIKNWQPGH